MHRDAFQRLRRVGPPSDHQSVDELMIYASTGGEGGDK
jgi:hypothetical protein